MNRYPRSLLLLLFLSLFAGCFKQEGLMFDAPPIEEEEPPPLTDATLLYDANSVGPDGQGLVAKVFNAAGDTALVFGAFLSNGGVTVRSLAYAKMESDTVMHVFFEDQAPLISGIALNLKSGQKLNTLLRFDDYISYSCVLSLLSADWPAGRAEAQGRWRVDKSTEIPAPVPVYIRDDCQALRPLTQTAWGTELGEILEVVFDRLNSLVDIDPAVFRGSDVLALQELLAEACTDTVLRRPSPPEAASFYPDDAFYQLTINDYPCLDHNGMMTRFRNTIDNQGNLVFSEVQGGQPPYGFAVDDFNFQSNSQIPGPFSPDRPYLLMVRDGNGCISSRIGYLGRPEQDACSIVCGKTWTPFEGLIVQDTGLPAYEANCDLLRSGCRRLSAGRCNDSTLVAFSAHTLLVEDFQLTFGNTGKVTVSYRFRYGERQELDPETCLLETPDDIVEEETATYFWYARTPQLLLLYDQDGVFGRIRIENPGNLRFEMYHPEDRTTLSLGMTVE